MVGMPLYGRAFSGVEEGSGGWGRPFQGTGEGGSWEAGVWDWKALPRPGAVEVHDVDVDGDGGCGASWSYDAGRRVLVSYDTVEVGRVKAEWVRREGLGGAMWWESSGDRRVGEGSLIEAVVGVWGEREGSENRLDYPESQYENVRKGFPGE